VIRGEILRQAVEFYPKWVTRRSLLNLLDMAGYPVLEEDLDFHLEYLNGKNLLELRIDDAGVGRPKTISMVRITTTGIDVLDNRRRGELGVRL
jgi:hypothetical protein